MRFRSRLMLASWRPSSSVSVCWSWRQRRPAGPARRWTGAASAARPRRDPGREIDVRGQRRAPEPQRRGARRRPGSSTAAASSGPTGYPPRSTAPRWLGRDARTGSRPAPTTLLRAPPVLAAPPGAGHGRRRHSPRPSTSRGGSCSARSSLPPSSCSPAAGGPRRGPRRAAAGRRDDADADDWGANDLEQRFELGPARDELTGLAATLDGLLGRIAASRRHEQRFASEVAHELRTPIARMRGRAELAFRAGPGGARSEAARRLVVAQVERLMKRSTRCSPRAPRAPAEARAVDLEAIARELEGVAVEVPPTGRGARATPTSPGARLPRSSTTPAATRAAGSTWLGAGVAVPVAVRDDGPGVPPGIGERAFDPGVRGEQHQGGADSVSR